MTSEGGMRGGGGRTEGDGGGVIALRVVQRVMPSEAVASLGMLMPVRGEPVEPRRSTLLATPDWRHRPCERSHCSPQRFLPSRLPRAPSRRLRLPLRLLQPQRLLKSPRLPQPLCRFLWRLPRWGTSSRPRSVVEKPTRARCDQTAALSVGAPRSPTPTTGRRRRRRVSVSRLSAADRGTHVDCVQTAAPSAGMPRNPTTTMDRHHRRRMSVSYLSAAADHAYMRTAPRRRRRLLGRRAA